MNRIPSRKRNEVICGILELCNLMEKSGSGFEKIVECYQEYLKDFKPQVYSDPAQFIVTLYDLTYDKNANINSRSKSTFEFKSPRSGNREYDRKIIEFCYDSPKSRLEIQNYLELSDKKYFINYILNPLLDAELLLTTQSSPYAPNQKYYINKDKLNFEN